MPGRRDHVGLDEPDDPRTQDGQRVHIRLLIEQDTEEGVPLCLSVQRLPNSTDHVITYPIKAETEALAAFSHSLPL